MKNRKYAKVVLSGGPCAGKTSALPKISEHFTKLGYQVLIIPEVATLLHGCGINLRETLNQKPDFLLASTLEIQQQLELSIGQLLNMEKNCLVLCDRGFYDYKAYVTPKLWEKFKYFGKPYYSYVVFLETVAKGAIQHFTNETNAARNCTPELAIELDNQTLEAWKSEKYNPAITDI